MNSAGSILVFALLAASPPGTLDPDDVPYFAPGRPYVEALFAAAGEPKPSDEDCVAVELDMAITNPAFPEVVRLASSPAFRERFAKVFEKSLGRKASTASIIRWAIRYDAGADDAWLAADLIRRERAVKVSA